LLGKLLLPLVLLLAGCAQLAAFNAAENETPVRQGLEGAIDAGIIIPFVPHDPDNVSVDYTVITPVRMEPERVAEVRAVFNPVNVRRMFFTRTNGRITMHVSNGDFVSEGDLLATLSFEDESIEIDRTMAEIALDRFEREFTLERMRLTSLVEDLVIQVTASSGSERLLLENRLALAELQLELYIRNSNARRATLRETLNDLEELMAGENLYSDVNGLVTHTAANNVFMHNRTTVVTIVELDEFMFQAQLSGQNVQNEPTQVNRQSLLRFGQVLHLESERLSNATDPNSGPMFSMDVEVVTDNWGPGRHNSAYYMLKVLDVESMLATAAEFEINLPTLMSLVFWVHIPIDFASDLLVVPRGAIHDQDGAFFVFLYEDGNPIRHFVELGMITGDMDYVQILFGLEEDTEIMLYH